LSTIEDNTSLAEAMRYSLFNGVKRVRPLLVDTSALSVRPALGTQQWVTLNQAASALESIHANIPEHDESPAMDNDDLRRGKPTFHIAFTEATAILAGDALQTLAFELLCDAPDLDAGIKLELVRQLAQAAGARGMVLGQALDLAAVNQPLDLTCLENMHRH